MLSLPDFAALQNALTLPLDPVLHNLLAQRLADALACGVEQLTHILIVEPGDTEEDFLKQAAFSPFHNPLRDLRYGQTGFQPHWDWCGQPVQGWFEWFTCVGNDGFAFIVLVPDGDGIDLGLRAMLQTFMPY